MAVTQEAFDGLVARLERYAKEHPNLYKARVFFLANLGYLYIFSILLVLLLLIGGLVAVVVFTHHSWGLIEHAGLPLVILTFIILRSLWVRFSPPEGIVLDPGKEKQLFQTVEEVRTAIQGPKVYKVLLTDDFNAAVVQHPTLGILGGYRNYLILGLPLMQSLSPEEFRAVLAHEFGHLSNAHGRFGSWIYRSRRIWGQLLERLEEKKHWASFVFDKFFNWYSPFFAAYTFVLARAQEYEADASAAAISGPGRMAEALLRIKLVGAYLREDYWPALYRKADTQSELPNAFAEMRAALSSGIPAEESGKWLDQALKVKTGTDDTHPSLKDRLSALKQEPRLLEVPDTSAAQQFLGENLSHYAGLLDERWKKEESEPWQGRYNYVRNSLSELANLREKAQRETLALEEAWQYACLADEFESGEAALPLYEKILQMDAEHPHANMAVGRLLLSKNREEGICHIDKAMEKDTEYIMPGTRLVYQFLMERNREEEAGKYYEQAEQWSGKLDAAHEERSSVGREDEHLPHGLSSAEIEKLTSQFAKYDHIQEVYIVRKKTEHFTEIPHYVIGLKIHFPWSQKLSMGANSMESDAQEKEMIRIRDRVAEEVVFPGEGSILVLNSEDRKRTLWFHAKLGRKEKVSFLEKWGRIIQYVLFSSLMRVTDDLARLEHLIYRRTA